MPQHHEEKMEPCMFQPDTRSTYKRKRNSVLGWPLERRDRFARNSAHPRSSERPPASRVSIHSWLPSRRQRGETFLVDASTSTRRARENEEERRIGSSTVIRSLGARCMPDYQNAREREDRSTEGIGARPFAARWVILKPKIAVSGCWADREEKCHVPHVDGGKEASQAEEVEAWKGEKDHGQRDSFLFVRYLICYGSVPCFCAADSEDDASNGKGNGEKMNEDEKKIQKCDAARHTQKKIEEDARESQKFIYV